MTKRDISEEIHVRAALAGNPNSGKTTLFNYLTGGNQYVGNWPGVTVEKKEGTVKRYVEFGDGILLTDLPGIYSITPYSMEEIVARDCIINDKPDVIINIVDAVNIERNLYLTLQLIETMRPVVVALNMMDEVRARGDLIDTAKLSEFLKVPVVSITARTGEGADELIKAVVQTAACSAGNIPDIYDGNTNRYIKKIARIVRPQTDRSGMPSGWTAVKLLEGDAQLESDLKITKEQRIQIEKTASEFEHSEGLGDRETIIADKRYKYIEKAVAASVLKSASRKKSVSEIIDAVLTNKILAIPIFLLVMFMVFTLTFSTFGAFLQECISGFINGVIQPAVMSFLISADSPVWINSLITEGVIGGVGGVLSFIPQIAVLFFLLSLLEDSGYMARIAFITDMALKKFGLSGKSFIPMLMGFGCSVPAVMAARTMENVKDRRMTILLVPFMSCSAKLPIYGFIAQIFFEKYRGLVVLSLYVIGILIGVLSGILFRRTLFKGGGAPFVLELPPYRMPKFSVTLRHVWDKIEHFVKKASTLIFGLSVVLWVLRSFDFSLHFTGGSDGSMLSIIGGIIAPVFKPAGFGTWQAAVALLTGLVAKEAVVSSICLFYGVTSLGGAEAAGALAGTFGSGAAAYAFLVFTLLYIPCVAAISAMKRELGSWKWTVFSALYQLAAAYTVSVIVYMLGTFISRVFF